MISKPEVADSIEHDSYRKYYRHCCDPDIYDLRFFSKPCFQLGAFPVTGVVSKVRSLTPSPKNCCLTDIVPCHEAGSVTTMIFMRQPPSALTKELLQNNFTLLLG